VSPFAPIFAWSSALEPVEPIVIVRAGQPAPSASRAHGLVHDAQAKERRSEVRPDAAVAGRPGQHFGSGRLPR
jgi:hypothetical protein